MGDLDVRVPPEFRDFIEKARRGEISVKIYFGHALAEAERPAFQEIIAMFEREYPGIDVIETPFAEMGVLQTQISAVASLPPEQRASFVGQVPDVFTWAHDWIGGFADRGWIIPLEEVLPSEAIVEDIAPQLIGPAFSSVVYKLKTYGLPYAGESVALIVNKRLVPTPPRDFSEMKAIMESYFNPAEGKYGLSLQFDPYHIYAFVTAFGGYWYDDTIGGPAGFGINRTETKTGVKWYFENIVPYLDVTNLGYTHQLDLFLNEKTPMIITGPWALSSIFNALGKDNVVITSIPRIDNRVPKPFAGFRNMYITIMAKEGGKERLYANILFVLYFTMKDDAVRLLVDRNGYVPVKRSVVDYVIQNKDKYPVVYGFMLQVMNSVPMPKDPYMERAWGVGTYLNSIMGEFTKALGEGKSRAEAAAAAVAIVDETLDIAQQELLAGLK